MQETDVFHYRLVLSWSFKILRCINFTRKNKRENLSKIGFKNLTRSIPNTYNFKDTV